ncbi:hypothetical protein [Pseudomonas sp. S3(2024)]|uniref:hypothetical protein n=1 Tax=Pseudomonas sp. S3(2024) TaxID=3111912 RepID=UPI002FE3D884
MSIRSSTPPSNTLPDESLEPDATPVAVKRWLAHIVPATAIIFILWLPFGFALTGLIEEWGILGLFVKHGIFFISDTSSPLPLHALRPLTILPQAVAFWLDNNSFFFWHVLLILALLIKGSSVSYIIEKLTSSSKLGIIACALVIIYPADTMQLSFRSLHINWALSITLLGSAVFLHALSLNRKSHALMLSIVASALLSSACFMYEASLLLACIPALFLFIRDGMLSALIQIKQKLLEHAIWVAGTIIYVAYALHTAPLVSSYQTSVVGPNLLASLKITYTKLFSIGLLRSTLGGWFDAMRITKQEFSSYGYVIAASIIFFFIIAAILRLDSKPKKADLKQSTRFNCRLAIAGLTLILFGYFPFLISPSHLLISQRTFLFATPGAALLLLAFISTGYRFSKPITNIVFGFFFIIGVSFQLYQFHHYIEISRKQATVLNEITEKFDGNIENKTLLILDHGNQLNYIWMFINEGLTGSLSFLYNKPISDIQVCHMPSKYWQHSDSLGRKGRCVENAENWTFEYPTPVSGPGFPASEQPASLIIPKTSIVTVEIGKESEDTQSGRTMPKSQGVVVERRDAIESARNSQTRFVRFEDAVVNDKFDWTFGKWWSMELPTHGTGWREAEWDIGSFYHHPSAWKIDKHANLAFEFKPGSNVVYELKGRFTLFAEPNAQSNMVIKLNGKILPIQWSENGEFEAQIDDGVLKNGGNNLEFDSPTNDTYFGLSARLEGIHIKRQQ